jgi:hypothetical protein
VTQADARIVEAAAGEVLAGIGEFERVYARAFGAPCYDEPPEAAQRFRDEQVEESDLYGLRLGRGPVA